MSSFSFPNKKKRKTGKGKTETEPYQVLMSGTSMALRVLPERMLNGRGAWNSVIPAAVQSVYRGAWSYDKKSTKHKSAEAHSMEKMEKPAHMNKPD